MLTISTLRMLNWKKFAGEVVLELGPVPYAVVAREEKDRDSSNWLGKSSLLEAIDFALTGRLPRSCKHRKKTDWITAGEKAGEVEIVLSNGARVKRWQSLTGSEQLRFWAKPFGAIEPKPAEQEFAQKEIDGLLGVARDDVDSWYFRQGEIAQLLKLDPAPRLALFSRWLHLDKLSECGETSAAVLADLARKREQATRSAAETRAAAARVLEEAGVEEAKLADAILVQRAAVDRAAIEDARLNAEVAARREREDLADKAARYDRAVADGMAISEKLKSRRSRAVVLSELQEMKAKAEAATLEVMQSEHACSEAKKIARGEFDGECPVLGAPCPVADSFVRAEKQSAEVHLAKLTEGHAMVRAKAEDVGGPYQALFDELVQIDTDEGRLRELRIQARALKPARDRWAELGAASSAVVEEGALERARASREECHARLHKLQAARDLFASSKERAETFEAEAAQLDRAARVASAGVAVFDAARRRIGEQVFGQVEAIAADMLERAGIVLEVSTKWGREGGGYADACGACGESFPASRKVKQCARCGAERGPKWIDRLDVEVFGRPTASGAADDLGAIALQFAAGRWVRIDRASPWAVCMLDEPVGQLDVAKRKVFANALPSMLKTCGFEQAFVIAHTSTVLDAFGARIEVVFDGKKSTARVIS